MHGKDATRLLETWQQQTSVFEQSISKPIKYTKYILGLLGKKKKKRCSAVHSSCRAPMWASVIMSSLAQFLSLLLAATTSVLATQDIIR